MLVTNGGKQAVYNAFATLLDPGDEVLLIAPYWTTYPEAIKLAGGVPVEVITDETTGYLATVEQLEAARTDAHQGAAVRLAVQPDRRGLPARAGRGDRRVGRASTTSGSSPTRSTSTWSTATPQMVSIAHQRRLRQVVVLNGVAKTYAMTGWRVGWLIGPTDVIKAATNLQSHATSNVANVVAGGRARRGHRRPVRGRRDARGLRPAPPARSSRMLSDIPGVVCPEPQGAFYAYPSVKGLLGRPLRGRVAADLGRAGRR